MCSTAPRITNIVCVLPAQQFTNPTAAMLLSYIWAAPLLTRLPKLGQAQAVPDGGVCGAFIGAYRLSLVCPSLLAPVSLGLLLGRHRCGAVRLTVRGGTGGCVC
jgi:hypothetical protein